MSELKETTALWAREVVPLFATLRDAAGVAALESQRHLALAALEIGRRRWRLGGEILCSALSQSLAPRDEPLRLRVDATGIASKRLTVSLKLHGPLDEHAHAVHDAITNHRAAPRLISRTVGLAYDHHQHQPRFNVCIVAAISPTIA